MNIIAFAASTSKHSINKRLVEYTLQQFDTDNCTLLDLNDFEIPLFSVDLEAEKGHPAAAKSLLAHIASADLLIISMAEHNGNFTAAFKNIFDWCSRVEPNVFQNKPLFLLSTSPGGYAGKNSLQAAVARFPRHAATILETFSLPSFGTNFDPEKGIIDETLKAELMEKIASVKLSMVG